MDRKIGIEDLEVWRSSRKLANVIYDLTGSGRLNRDYGLKDQMRRAAVSGMSNVAEGFYSRTNRGFIQFLGLARASIGELRSQLFIALDRDYIDRASFESAYNLCDKASRQTYRLMNYLKAKQNTEQG